ncbi:MAG: hypothetical protein ICV60_11030 [Pyrinomonadaceae bacterium]|nr:hypothetical protein [Pyrinomonadaceae bacterium]
MTMRNTGTVTWTSNEGFKLGSESPRDNSTWGMNRVNLPSTVQVAPGAIYTFAFKITAPTNPGVYSFQWRMVHELVEWFGDFSTLINVSDGFVRVAGNNFYVGSVPWYPYGINYFPLNGVNPPIDPPYNGIATAEHWFLPNVYNARYVEADLSLIENLGMNMVAIQLPLDSRTKPNVVDFLNRCVRHGLRIYLELRMDAVATASAPERAELMEKCLAALSDPDLNLANRPEIFAYSVAWEPHIGWRDDKNVRVRWNRIFTRWLSSTFGSIPNALAALGYSIKPPGTPGLEWQAGFESYTMPVVAQAGSNVSVSFTLKNTGEYSWLEAEAVRLLGWLPGRNELRLSFSRQVNPGNSITISGAFSVPTTPGRYVYDFRMVHEAGSWFAFGEALEVEVEVVANGSTIMRTFPLPAPPPAPTNNEILGLEPQSINWVLGYRRALDLEVSRRFGKVARLVRMRAPNQLVTIRQGIDGNNTTDSIIWFPLDAPATGAHLDFLSPENYFYDPAGDSQNAIRSAVAVQSAYARWASGGRPVCWVEFGRSLTNVDLNGQAAFMERVVNAILEVGDNGAAPWWYPGGLRVRENSDYGIVDTNRTPRPSANKLAAMAPRAKSPRNVPVPGAPFVFNPATGAKGFADIYPHARQVALQTLDAHKSFVMKHVGEGTSSDSPIILIGSFGTFTRDLWADLYLIELKVGGQSWFEITAGQVYAVPANTPIYVRGRVKNLGVAEWVAGNVRFAANENFGAGFRWGIPAPVKRLEEVVIPEMLLSNGISNDTRFQFQMVAENRTWIDGSVRIMLIPLA